MYARLGEIISLDAAIAVTLAAHQAIGLKVTCQHSFLNIKMNPVHLFQECKSHGFGYSTVRQEVFIACYIYFGNVELCQNANMLYMYSNRLSCESIFHISNNSMIEQPEDLADGNFAPLF